MHIQEKTASDLVTNIDLEIEEMIITFIKKHYPNDLIIAEETLDEKLTDQATWLIDPIDGTVNFSYGSTLYGIQLCHLINKEAIFTLMYLPASKDIYHAIKGQGAYRNNLPLHVQKNHPLHLSLVSFGDFSKSSYPSRPYQMTLIDHLKESVMKIRIFGSSCIDFTAVASGQTHAHIMFSKRIWEFYAGLLLCKEAGLLTEIYTIPNTDIHAIIACHTKPLLKEIKEILS